MRKKLKVVLSVALLATLVTGAAPLLTASNTVTVEAAAANSAAISGMFITGSATGSALMPSSGNTAIEEAAAVDETDSEISTNATVDSSATMTESETEKLDETNIKEQKTAIKESFYEIMDERTKKAIPAAITVFVGTVFALIIMFIMQL